jgi:phosphate:Na+ symporter
MLVTGLIQSSSATTVITIGLVSTGFMTLRQAVGVIMGANIGTTVTAFIIGFKFGDFALPIMAIGAILLFLSRNKKLYEYGQIIFGFGSLFYGLELMSKAAKPLFELETLNSLIVYLSSDPLLGVLFGTISTGIIQSSSATVGILQGLHAQSIIDLEAALPIVFGDNIGTTIKALLVSIGASVIAKRAAVSHVLINIISTILFLLILEPFTAFILWLKSIYHLNPEMTIAFAHGIFNLASTILLIPFIGLLIKFVTKIVPDKSKLVAYEADHLDPIFIEQSSSIALGQAKEEIVTMGNLAVNGLKETNLFMNTKERKHALHANQAEETLNFLDLKITNYLIEISSASLSMKESEEQNKLMKVVKDLEKIGDHFENIIELVEFQIATNVKIPDSVYNNLVEMFQLTIKTVQKAIITFDQNDKEMARLVMENEFLIDKMERQLRKQHIFQMTNGESNPQAGIIYIDIISNLERIADHAVNIANTVLIEQHHIKEMMFKQSFQ